MKVTHRTDSLLELHEGPGVVWVIGAVFGVGGMWVLLQEGERLLAAGFAALVIALALAFATTTTCRLDRGSGEFACSRRTVFGTKQVRHPLGDIVDVRTERSRAQHSQTYRVVLGTASGAAVPLTTHFSSGHGQQEEAANAIRDFLGLAKPVDAPIPGFGDLFRMATGAQTGAALGNMFDGAIAHHETEVQRAPDNVNARRQLGMALAMGNRPAEARVHLEHARDVARRAGNDRIASELDEVIGRLA